MSNLLMPLEECPDLYADACCISREHTCLFLSVWGRDTAIQEFLARLTLPAHEDGLSSVHFYAEGARHHAVFTNMDNYSKRSTRTFRQTRFGNLIHLWIYDRRCTEPDRSNHEAFVLLDKTDSDTADPNAWLWPRVRDLCPLPLLDHWRTQVMQLLHDLEALMPVANSIGPTTCWHINIDESVLATSLSRMIRDRVLTVD